MSDSVKIPPQNQEVEASFLGALLLDRDAIIKVSDIIAPADFYSPANLKIFETVMELFAARVPIDIITLSNRLQEKKELEEVGGASYLSTLVNLVPSAAHIVDYAKIIRHKATLRRLLAASTEISELAFKEEDNIDEIIDKSEQLIFNISQRQHKMNFVQLKDILTDSFERIDEIHKNKGALRGVPSGFARLDDLLGGFQPSDLIILAARPSMGKTSLALNVAQYASIEAGIPVGIFSLEMSKEQIVDRLICMEAQVDSWKLRTGHLSDEDFPRIGQAMGKLSEAQLFIDDSPMASVMEIRTKARRLQSEHGLGLIVIDYLQLMGGSSNVESRVQEVSQISRSLKALARELNVPVIALSQLSRTVETRTPQIPQLSDLRESGSIEQDADVVAFIYREDYYVKDSPRRNIADILIRKHRNGPIGQVELYFIPDHMAFKDLERKREGEYETTANQG